MEKLEVEHTLIVEERPIQKKVYNIYISTYIYIYINENTMIIYIYIYILYLHSTL